MIIDPWGTVIARSSDKPGIILAEIDPEYVTQVRQSTFTLDNRRPDVYELNKKAVIFHSLFCNLYNFLHFQWLSCIIICTYYTGFPMRREKPP